MGLIPAKLYLLYYKLVVPFLKEIVKTVKRCLARRGTGVGEKVYGPVQYYF